MENKKTEVKTVHGEIRDYDGIASWAVITYMKVGDKNELVAVTPYSVYEKEGGVRFEKFHAPLDRKEIEEIEYWYINADYVSPRNMEWDEEDASEEVSETPISKTEEIMSSSDDIIVELIEGV